MFYSPLRYPGGKTCIYNFMSSILIENKLIGCSYAEPYAGGAGLALKLLFNNVVKDIHINDLDPSIHAFWYNILNNPHEICSWIEHVDINMENWKKYKKILSYNNNSTSLELAQATLFLNRVNISGIIKGGPIGGQLQKGNYKMNARFNKDSLISKILQIAKLKSQIILSNQDGIDFIETVEKRKNTFIYIDPPYYDKGSKLYRTYFTEHDHEILCNIISTIQNTWLLSYDNNSYIRNLYSNQKIIKYNLSQCTSNRIGKELFIMQENMKHSDSIALLKSPSI